MLNRIHQNHSRLAATCHFHTSSSLLLQQFKQKPASQNVVTPVRTPLPTRVADSKEQKEDWASKHEKRNELGVQLLSRQIHSQIFKNVSFPHPQDTYVRIARDHLAMHELDPSQGSLLANTAFTLPPLQGATIDEHFHRLGAQAAQPWLTIANDFSSAEVPPKPECWNLQSGWTKYVYQDDGSSFCLSVDAPEEEALVFDVETLPAYHQYAIMACAVSKTAWYSWLSPWLLNETEDPKQLIPLGDPNMHRVVVGHNVSYDRSRVLEEYNVGGTRSRFLDTMALHVAVNGISSHQRPAWHKYRKSKEAEADLLTKAVEAVADLRQEAEEKQKKELDLVKKEEYRTYLENLPSLSDEDSVEELTSKRWEDITSVNSLADVAKLHCNIEMDKEIRNDFLTLSREEIGANVHDYLDYCAHDVFVTHAVFCKTLPAFTTSCPSPVSFAGILTMGSSFLTVNDSWEEYLENAERTYKELDNKIKARLLDLCQQAKEMVDAESWKEDPWLSQLDWTPKVAGKSRGVGPVEEPTSVAESVTPVLQQPAWYLELLSAPTNARSLNRILPLLLEISFDGHPIQYSSVEKWHYLIDGEVIRLPFVGKAKTLAPFSSKKALPYLKKGLITSRDVDLAISIAERNSSEDDVEQRIIQLANDVLNSDPSTHVINPWLSQLDWKLTAVTKIPRSNSTSVKEKPPPIYWPKWYWDLAKPKKDMPPGSIDITVRSRVSPILLKLSWRGWPLFHSREHGWTFRVPVDVKLDTRAKDLVFCDPADVSLARMSRNCPLEDVPPGNYNFYKLPHKDGEKANVGNPLAKPFMKYSQDGTLTSPGDDSKDALDMNAQCSYWISARDRVTKQMVVWQQGRDLGFPDDAGKKWGVILPQLITMGTVTRRAIEKTWLTASNAKKNRVGSELKALVRAPPGYAIVGADVDSEELWISSVMGDAQFGMHGATAIGWMTLEGTKAAGTDLHSKTASILGITRDQAKVFNYSRIYGAGMRHAVLLLLQSNASMLPEQAQKLAGQLYASTKGKNTQKGEMFGRKFWFGGTESFVFNKLEEIAMSDCPQTPALGCGVTYALSKEYLPAGFGTDYMPSRINWVVQSSGVDYLHLLIVSMQHLINKYEIRARFLISVHDELRYLVAEEDQYRAALALQIANVWTRSLFAYKLGMDDLPQGVAWFSAVDIDKVLRKETDMPCVTPSQPIPIPPGESLSIAQILEKTNSGSLWKDGRQMIGDPEEPFVGNLEGYKEPDCLRHRAASAAWLRAQTTDDLGEVRHLAKSVPGKKIEGRKNDGGVRKQQTRKAQSRVIVGVVEWSEEMEIIKNEATKVRA